MAQILDYGPVTKFNADDVFLIDGETDGTRTIAANELYYASIDNESISVELRRSTWRGKDLGTSVTADQFAEIKAGTFRDLFLGDFWSYGGNKFRIVDFDYWYGLGDTPCTTHHLVIMPDAPSWTNEVMNYDRTNANGYAGSYMHVTRMPQILNSYKSFIGDTSHVLSYRTILTTKCDSNGLVTACSWHTCQMELPSELMMTGTYIKHAIQNGTASISNEFTPDLTQLAAMRINPSLIYASNNVSCWLRDPFYSGYFSQIRPGGGIVGNASNGGGGPRVVFGIVG